MLLLLLLIINGNSQSSTSTVDAKKLTVSDQVVAIAGVSAPKDLTAKDIIKNDDYRASGLVPLSVISSTKMLAIASDANITTTTAAVNSANGLATLDRKIGAGETSIAAAFLLPEQREDLLASLARKKVDVSIVSPTPTGTSTVTTVPANPYSRGVYSMSGSSAYVTSTASNMDFNTAWTQGTASSSTSESSSRESKQGPVQTAFNFFFYALLILVLLYALRAFMRMNRNMNPKKPSAEKKSDIPSTRFADVAGCEEAIEDMKELVLFLKEPERFSKTGAVGPRGAILVGPPGTGKTLLARAVAGEAGVPFFSAAGSDFVEMYVGVGARRVRDLFERARKHEEGAIIFIDEIDAVGRARASAGSPSSGANTEQEGTLNALLVEMDGFKDSNVIVLAATNRVDILDKALLRPGRFDRTIQVPLPDRIGREKIVRVHAAGRPFEESVDWSLVGRRTPGMSGAELAQVVNEACLVAAREDRSIVTDADLDSAIATVIMGKARTSAVISEEDRALTAWHEAGHAICGLVQTDAVSPVSISIIPRGAAGGVTHFPSRDSGYISRKQAYAQLVVALGGMAAEQMLLGEGEFTTGPSSDLQQASNIALSMVTQYGMGESLLVKSDNILHAANTQTDDAVNEADHLLRQALADAKDLLEKNRKLVTAMVDALLEWDTLTNAQIEDLVRGKRLVQNTTPPPAPRAVKEPIPVGVKADRRVREDIVIHERIPALARIAAGVYHGVIAWSKGRRRGA